MTDVERALVEAVAARLGVGGHRIVPLGLIEPWARQRITELHLSDVSALIARAISDERLWAELVAMVLNGQTYFYRDAEQIEAIVSVLSDMANDDGPRTMRVWCAGCSTGEEPYTIAIACARRGLSVGVVGTDVNPTALAVADQGRYLSWQLRHVPADALNESFRSSNHIFLVREDVRSAVEFAEHNLIEGAPPVLAGISGAFDVVVCRNVIIYYEADDGLRIVRRLIDATAPRGVVALGASDSHWEGAVCLHGRLFHQRLVDPSVQESISVPAPTRASPSTSQASCARPAAEPIPARVDREDQSWFDVVVTMVEEQDTNGAIRLIEEQCVTAPNDVPLLHALGNLRTMSHELNEALLVFGRAGQLDPLHAETGLFAALALRKLDRWQEARSALQRSLSLDPGSWIASYLMWGTLVRLGLHAEAEQEAQRATMLIADRNDLAMAPLNRLFALMVPGPSECASVLAAR